MIRYILNLLFKKKRNKVSESFTKKTFQRYAAGSVLLQNSRFVTGEEKNHRKLHVLKLKF